jgi:mxaL protein
MKFAGATIDQRTAMIIAAVLLTIAACIGFVVVLNRPIVDAVAIVDITGSMNTRDMGNPHGSETRLDAAKQALIDMIPDLPCRSRLGLGIFTERRSFLLFEPVEVCENYDALSGAISGLDWRMAWQGDSWIAKGLYSAIDVASALNSNLIFLTDGQEAPPTPYTGTPEFEGKVGAVKGLIVGVGGSESVPIPKFDDEGHQIGVYGPEDVEQENRVGPPPPGMETREGYNARNAPWGGEAAVGNEHMTSVKTAHLEELAAKTGLNYAELQKTGNLSGPLQAAARTRIVSVATNLAYIPAALALLITLLAYALPELMVVFDRLGLTEKFSKT